MKKRNLIKIISAFLCVIMLMQIVPQTVLAAAADTESKGEVIVLSKDSPIMEVVYIGIGWVAGVLYLSRHVPPDVLFATIISMFGHGYEKGKGAGYILEIASSYIPKEDWTGSYPHPKTVNESKGIFSVYMDSRFLNKKFCLEYADEIIDKHADGKTFHGMDSERIAVELYGHAFIHYAIYFVRVTPLYFLFKNTVDDFYNRSDPIDVNFNESERRMKIFNLLWGK